jgi:hypothetical protein
MYWVLYFVFLLTCNKHLSLEIIEEYIQNFGIENNDINKIIIEYDKCTNDICQEKYFL